MLCRRSTKWPFVLLSEKRMEADGGRSRLPWNTKARGWEGVYELWLGVSDQG